MKHGSKGKRACILAGALLASILLVGCAGSAGEGDTSGAEAGASSIAEASASGAEGSNAPSSAESRSAANAGLAFDSIPPEAVMSIDELKKLVDDGANVQIIDIRDRSSWSGHGHIDRSRSIPAGRQLDFRYEEIKQNRDIILVDQANDRLAEYRQTLIDYGYDESLIKVVDGGMDAWEAAGYPVSEPSRLAC